MSAPTIYEFGPFRFDAEQRLLFRDGQLVPLAPKASDTLQVLLARRGRLVGKAELMKLVWPDTTVEEIGLARNISLLRKALGDDDAAATYIETIPKRGYRFIADVVEVGAAPAAAPLFRLHLRWWLPAVALAALLGFVYWQFYLPSRYLPRGAGFASLAVVPFTCLSPELDCGAFPYALDDLLVADLSQLDHVTVVSPTTVRRYLRARLSMSFMSRLLGLDVLVEGTIQRAGERVRITSRLVDVHTGKVIWSDSYEYPLAEAAQSQAEAARAITQQVAARLAAAPASR